jgi:hypothetical protein
MRVLLFITTHLSAQHVLFMRSVWPSVVAPLLFQCDVLFFTTSPSPPLFRDLFHGNFTTVTYNNTGYQSGAIQAMTYLQTHRDRMSGYDWVIRLNPDVIIKNSDWIETVMQDPDVDGIFVDCFSSGCQRSCTKGHIHTDLTIFRPRSLPHTLLNITHSETHATALFNSVVARGRDRWVPHTTQHGSCRVNSPDVVHDHSLLELHAV